MITQMLAMQSTVAAQNATTARMIGAADAMLSTVAFGNSQPLRPYFGLSADSFELQGKSDETRMTVLQKRMAALEKSIAKSIGRSTPKYGGLNYKA